MKPEDVIIHEAIKTIWQNPTKDKQSIIKMARISPINGYFNIGQVGWDEVETPLAQGQFHFYQLGDNYPGDFNLIARKYQWYRLSEWCEVRGLVIHCYNQSGKLIPLKDVYQIRLYNDNIIIAVRLNDKIFNLNDEALYMHFYLNQFFSSVDKESQTPHIEYRIAEISRDDSSWVDLMQYLSIAKRRDKGAIRATYNGELIEPLPLYTECKQDDSLELHYDMSIKKVIDLPIKSLRTFKSTLDDMNKYLLHPPKDGDFHIDYRDDVDVFVCKRDKRTGKVTGRYYHRNQENSIRMVTHRDYSVPVPYVQYYIREIDPNPDTDDFFIRLYIRHNQSQVLGSDENMIRALYTLDDDKLIEAMVTVDSNLPAWQADNLEKSSFTGLMRSQRKEVTAKLALEAMGYNGTIKTLANPYIAITFDPNGNYFDIPIGLVNQCTIYEYDLRGRLMGWYHHNGLKKYYPRHFESVFIEAISGLGGDTLTINEGHTTFNMKKNVAYRFYLANIAAGERISEWKDATSDERIHIVSNECTFNYDPFLEVGFALGDDQFLSYDINLDDSDGMLEFRLTEGFEHTLALRLPLGKINLWLNGYALIEGVDYYIDFPKCVIVNKRYLREYAQQQVTVRCHGFPISDKGILKRWEPLETGFIQYGKLSVNEETNFYQDRIVRVTANGGVSDARWMPFEETFTSAARLFEEDGAPYCIETPAVSLSGTLGIGLYGLQTKDIMLTKQVQDYLTYHNPVNHPTEPVTIKNRYPVYSPFLSKVIMDLRYGRLRGLPSNASIMAVDQYVEKYKPLLTLDPVIRGFDEKFVIVHPHCLNQPLELSPLDYQFVKRLSDIYLKSKVDITLFLTIRNGKTS